MTETNLTAYCVRCKTMRPLADAEPVFLANGRAATAAAALSADKP